MKMIQEYSSAKTAVNGKQGKLPMIFKHIDFPENAVVLDYGGGDQAAWNLAQDYLNDFKSTELIYDPFNQTEEHNQNVIGICENQGGADIAICSNVLNVVKEIEIRTNILKHIKQLMKPNSPIYITVYEGDGKGIGKPTQNNQSYQNNKKTEDYLEEVMEVFGNAIRHGKIISAIA